MTYWRSRNGGLAAWPRKAWHGPARPLKRDAPADPGARIDWLRAWQAKYQAWVEAVHTALIADPAGARRRFADFATACCECGRPLTDTRSKVIGIGPDCRRGMSENTLAQLLTPAIASAHAARENRLP
ncbi:DUF6011 domain-containing protein [Streptomyces sp. CAU 1734]|uniref:DUF6011 domain-containing protein n=1 Tax=Streptomyces sp. CAU 1734 TaxID=3140360 RepID=UPI003261598E